MTTTSSYFFPRALVLPLALSGGLWLSAPVLAAPAAPPPLSACAAPVAAAGAAAAASDIDYTVINQHLTDPDARRRLTGLQAAVRQLKRSRAPEAGLVHHRLVYALAQTQAGLGRHAEALASLKQLPVSSPQAPEALLLLAELEVAEGQPLAAVRWLRQLADLYPGEAASVGALWRAAELSEPDSPQALSLWQQAADLADQGLAAAQRWQAQSGQPGFLDLATADRLSPELWRLARATLGSATFAGADALQTEARRQLQCLTVNQEAQLRRLQRNPRLLADLGDTVDTLAAQLQGARHDLVAREEAFLASARRLKECTSGPGDCVALKAAHDAQGRELTGWRNRVRILDGKLAFLRQEKEKLRASAVATGTGTGVARQLGSRLGDSRGLMQEQLQQSLAMAVQEWEALSAQAHYKLALAQESRVTPGRVPGQQAPGQN